VAKKRDRRRDGAKRGGSNASKTFLVIVVAVSCLAFYFWYNQEEGTNNGGRAVRPVYNEAEARLRMASSFDTYISSFREARWVFEPGRIPTEREALDFLSRQENRIDQALREYRDISPEMRAIVDSVSPARAALLGFGADITVSERTQASGEVFQFLFLLQGSVLERQFEAASIQFGYMPEFDNVGIVAKNWDRKAFPAFLIHEAGHRYDIGGEKQSLKWKRGTDDYVRGEIAMHSIETLAVDHVSGGAYRIVINKIAQRLEVYENHRDAISRITPEEFLSLTEFAGCIPCDTGSADGLYAQHMFAVLIARVEAKLPPGKARDAEMLRAFQEFF